MKAVWNDVVLAESDDVIILERNAYFPMNSLKKEYFEQSQHLFVFGKVKPIVFL